MEVKFQKTVCSFLEAVPLPVRHGEQTQEIRIPEGMPDIGRVLWATGQAVLRSKEWRGRSIAVTAGMMVRVLYCPEGENTVQCVEGWIPFSFQWDLPEDTPEGSIRALCLTRFVDARSVSAGKLMVRAGMSMLVQVYAPKSAEIYLPEETEPDVQLLKNTYPVCLTVEAGEKHIQLEEELTLPSSVPEIREILSFRLNPEITEGKIMAGKTVFRGDAKLHLLYAGEGGQLHSWDFSLPFSQYGDLEGTPSPEAGTDVLPMVTALELELLPEGKLRLKCGITCQFLLTDKRMVELAEDAYSPRREVEVRLEELALPAILDSRRISVCGEEKIPVEANLVADVDFLPEYPYRNRTEKGILLELSGHIRVLYYDENGAVQSAARRWEGIQSLQADPESCLSILPAGTGETTAAAGAGCITVKPEQTVALTAYAGRGLPMVTGLTLGSLQEACPGRPSLILCRAGSESLWQLARKTGSTMEAIRKANGLTGEPAPDRMLLIPVP